MTARHAEPGPLSRNAARRRCLVGAVAAVPGPDPALGMAQSPFAFSRGGAKVMASDAHLDVEATFRGHLVNMSTAPR